MTHLDYHVYPLVLQGLVHIRQTKLGLFHFGHEEALIVTYSSQGGGRKVMELGTFRPTNKSTTCYLQTTCSPSPNSEWTATVGEIERKIMDSPIKMHNGDDTLKKVQEGGTANCRLA